MAWLDAPTWVQDQLAGAFPAWLVTPESDDIRLEKFPAVIWSLSVANPDDRGIWTGNLTATLLCDPDAAAANLAALYDVIQGWQTPGPINTVTLISSAAGRSQAGRNPHSYRLVYSLLWDH